MLRKQLMSVFGPLLVVCLLIAACAPAEETAQDTEDPAAEEAAPDTEATPAPDAPPEEGTEEEAAPEDSEEAAPEGSEEGDSAADAGGTYRIGIFSDLTTLNYWNYLGPDSTVWNAYFQIPQRITLANLSDVDFQLYPWSIEELPARPMEQEGEFWVSELTLREGITWSDGTPFTANDVAFTFNTAIDLRLPGNWTSNVDPEFYDRVEAVDDRTVKFYFTQEPGLAVFEYGGLQTGIMSEAYWSPIVEDAAGEVGGLGEAPAEDAPEEEQTAYQESLTEALNVLFQHEPDGEPLAGAFTFGRWETGAFAENSANETYFETGATETLFEDGSFQLTTADGTEFTVGEASSAPKAEYTVGPNASSVIYTLYSDQNAAILALQDGEIDFMLNSLGLQRGLQQQLEAAEGVEVVENQTNGFRYMSFNTRKAPMNDVAFRQAVALLIDKEFVTNQVLQGAAFPFYTFVPEGNAFWYSNDVPKLGLNEDGTPLTREERVAEATRILTDAGYSWEGGAIPEYNADNDQVDISGPLLLPDGTPVPEMNLLAPAASYDPLRSTFATWIEQYLTDFGIPVTAELTGFNVIVERVFEQQDFDMYMLGWSLTIFPDYLRDFFHSDRAVVGDNNAGAYSNPEFDELSDQIKLCTDLVECQEISVQIQQILAEEVPYVLLFDTGIVEAYRTDSLEYPYKEALGGFQFLQGLPATVAVK
ncbi:MAG: ABC transporter substrate-binding protein [Chloroflexi bacterium AL-W]|nr:ABC transporter substrate-binding protein [Chloroflexi bacterium AL-W]